MTIARADSQLDSSTSVYTFASLRVRVIQAFLATGFPATVGIIAALELGAPWGFGLVAATVAIVTAECFRAFRLSLRASPEGVVVRNFWRDFEVSWLDVLKVGLGERSAGETTMPAIAFVLRDGRVILAHATPDESTKRIPLIASLETIAPPSVQFLRDDARERRQLME